MNKEEEHVKKIVEEYDFSKTGGEFNPYVVSMSDCGAIQNVHSALVRENKIKRPHDILYGSNFKYNYNRAVQDLKEYYGIS